MKTLLCSICFLISVSTFAQKKDTINAFAPKVVFQECLDKPLQPDFYKGKFLILDFWATWCAPCIAGFPHFNELVDKYGNANVVFASYTVEPESIQAKFFERTKKQLRAYKLSDTTKSTINKFGIATYPSCVIINPDNVVVWEGSTYNLTAEILEKVILKNENLLIVNPIASAVPVLKMKKKMTRPLFYFNLTEADTDKNIHERYGSSSSANGTLIAYTAPKVFLSHFLQDLTGFSASSRILTNDSSKLWTAYNVDFTTKSDDGYYKNFINSVFESSPRKNFILSTFGDALKFDAGLVKKQTKHYELIITDTAKLHAFMSMQKGHSSFDDDHLPKFEIVGYNLKDIAQYLENDTKTIITTPDINNTDVYDLSFDLTNTDSFKNGLKMYGLGLKEVTSEVTFLNINFY